MSLRAYFAGQAIANPQLIDEGGTVASAAKELGIEVKDYNYVTHWPILVARRSIQYADALIAELGKEES